MKRTKQQDLTNWCFTPFDPNFCCSEVKNQAVLSALASNQHHRNLYFSWKWDLSRGCVRSQNCGSLKMSKQARQKLYPPKTDLVLLRITISNSTNSRATKNLKKTTFWNKWFAKWTSFKICGISCFDMYVQLSPI